MLNKANILILKYFQLHQFIFFAGISILLLIDFFLLEEWATFWIMIFWAMVFGIHFMIFRSQNVDDEWLEEKIIFDVYRPWDYGHIDQIKRNPFGKSIYRTEQGKMLSGMRAKDKPNQTDPND